MRLEDILNDNQSGATKILQNLIILLKEKYVDQETDFVHILKVIERVQKSHPFMAVFRHLNSYLQSHRNIPLDSALDNYSRELQYIFRSTVSKAAGIMEKYAGIVTISYSSVVEQVFQRLSPEDHHFHILESRPILEGVLLAKNLSARGYRVALWVDSAMAKAVEKADLVVFGADIVCRSGVVNKIGSLPLTLLAKRMSRPVYVIADSSKEWSDFNYDPSVDKHPGSEVTATEADIEVQNPYFDLVPWDLIDFRVKEDGIEAAV